MKRWLFVLAALALMLPTMAGTAMAQQEQAMLRVVHASPDAPPVDVIVDDNKVFTDVSFKEITPYVPLDAGAHNVRVVRAGTDEPAVLQATVNLQPESFNTVAAVGRLENIRAVPLVDRNCLPASNRAAVRVVHASPNAPAVDVAVADGPVLFNNVAFPNATDYRTVEAGAVNLPVRQAGTQTTVLDVPEVTLEGSTVYTVYAVGLVDGDPPLQALVAVDAPPPQATEAPRAAQSPQATGSPQGAKTP